MRRPLAALVLQFALASRLVSQTDSAHSVRWWEVAVVVGGVGLASVADHGIDIWIQDHRSSSSDNLATVFRQGGQPAVVFGIGGGITLTGLITGHDELRRSGERVLASTVVAGIVASGIKLSVGRLRPSETDDPYVFKPFSGHESFPSGHATLAFALATSLSAEIHNPWASAGLYTFAAGTAWSRLNDHLHWFSDVLMGGAVGITGAQVMEGRWRIFGLGPPQFLVTPTSARLSWDVEF